MMVVTLGDALQALAARTNVQDAATLQRMISAGLSSAATAAAGFCRNVEQQSRAVVCN